jgi:prevent-host-death family protein
MAKTFNVAEARAHFSEILDRAAAGEDIVIAKAGKPLVRLVPIPGRKRRPNALRHWNIPTDVLLEPLSEEDLLAAEGAFGDEWGISASLPTEK